MSNVRLLQIEAKLDTLDPDSQEWFLLNEEANALADDITTEEDRIFIERQARQADMSLKQRMSAHKARVNEKYGSYNDWFEWAKSLYTITDDFRVISNAANWKEQKIWKFKSEMDCLEKVEVLVGYKIQDRNRGFGDINKDLDNFKKSKEV